MGNIPEITDLESLEQARAILELEDAQLKQVNRLKIEREEKFNKKWWVVPLRYCLQAISAGIVFAAANYFIIEKLDNLRTDVAKAQQKVEQKNNELSVLEFQAEKKAAESKIAELAESEAKLKKSFEKTEADLESKENELAQTKIELRNSKEQIKAAQATKNQKKGELQAKIASLRKRVDGLEQEKTDHISKIAQLERFKEQIEAAPEDQKGFISLDVELPKRGVEKPWKEIELKLLNVGNFKQKADFAYRFSGEWLYSFNIEAQSAIAKQNGNHMYIIRVESTKTNPETAKFTVFRITVPESRNDAT